MVANAPTSVLERVIASSSETLSPESARVILTWKFSAVDQQKMHVLLDKSKRGELTPEESQEAHEFAAVGDVLSLLHLKARLSLGLPLTQPGNSEE